MLNTKTHEILFSFDQPDTVLHPLLSLLQEVLHYPKAKASKLVPLHSQTVLIIDTYGERPQHIAHLLASSGYRPLVVSTAVDAFTLFLQGTFVPFVVILGQEHTSNRFFIFRLLHQTTQKYDWEPPLIHLYSQSSNSRLPHTAPLPTPNSSYQNPISTSSLPLPQIPLSRPSLAPQTSPLDSVPQVPFPPLPPLPLHTRPLQTSSSSVSTSPLETSSNKKDGKKISLEGQDIGRYHMHSPLGSGSFGTVYRTYDRLREQDVALKAIQMNTLRSYRDKEVETEINFFQQEIDLLSALDHPNILPPLNCGKSYISGAPFVYKTMRYCPEGSLTTLLYQLGTSKLLSAQEVSSIVVQVADALQHVHNYRITYQNFKLSNLLIRERAKDRRSLHILLTDFAVAQNGTLLAKTEDTFPYMAPERWNGQSLPASDQYGLAAIAYELLTGRMLFQGQSEQIMRQLHMSIQPQPLSMFNPQVSPALSNVVLRALAKRPEDRFESIALFAQAFQQYNR